MRTNIVIDDALMSAAMQAGGFKTKRDAVEEGLRLLARRATYQRLLALGGKLDWQGEPAGDWSGVEAGDPAPKPGALRSRAPRKRAARRVA